MAGEEIRLKLGTHSTRIARGYVTHNNQAKKTLRDGSEALKECYISNHRRRQ
jgi:hypothetical protein